jgi:mannan endo-1,4-beta-mannosidase
MFISGRHLYSAAGERVILRGVNEMFVWSDDKRGEKYLPEIAQTGANCVRLVWTAEYGNENALVDLIENCISHKMIAMPECHSATGEWDNLDICVNFWNNPALIEGIQRNKRWTLLNIGNEVGDGNVSAEQFLNGYKRAIDSLRGWGYTVPIVIDASTWGQNVDVILDTWEEIQEYDPLNNVLFSVHSYWSNVNNYQKVATASVNDRLAVIIGEGPSPTAYPTCNILDYGTGLESTGKNDIGWLSWSWGGMPNGHCIPNFDHTYDGIFGAWRTTYAADMMVDHPYSLMRTASRPASFYPGDTVIPSGIYLAPDQDSIIVGDTLSLEVLLTPVNAYSKEFTLTITGDEDAVNYQPETGKLVAVAKGYVEITVRSVAVPNLVFSRNIQVLDIPVSSLTFTPSAAHMLVDDTLYFEVELLPENATDQEYLYKVLNPEGAIAVDTLAGMVLAKTAGTASIIVEWNGGEVSDTLHIAVTENTSGEIGRKVPEIILFPNPNEGLLYITNDQLESFELQVLDLSGKLFIETRYTGKTMIDTSILPGGTYVVLHKGMDMVLRHKLIMI